MVSNSKLLLRLNYKNGILVFTNYSYIVHKSNVKFNTVLRNIIGGRLCLY